jgi:TPR repeat protein
MHAGVHSTFSRRALTASLPSADLHGLGTKNGKSNKKEAAFWYRAAVAQGSSEAGLSWCAESLVPLGEGNPWVDEVG